MFDYLQSSSMRNILFILISHLNLDVRVGSSKSTQLDLPSGVKSVCSGVPSKFSGAVGLIASHFKST